MTGAVYDEFNHCYMGRRSLLWHGSRFSSGMAEKKSYTIYFTYDVNDHSLRFPLCAEVEGADCGVYTITNIRQDGQHGGALFPPIRVQKKEGVWIIMDTDTGSRLSAAIGAAIDEQEQEERSA
jgi:hypothetical protein